MEIYGEDKDSGKSYKADSDKVNQEFIDEFSNSSLSDTELKKVFDGLDISADMKSTLFKFAKVTIKVGRTIISIGKKIFEFVLTLVNEYPNTMFGIIFGITIGLLVSSIPILGVVFGPLIMPLATIFGMINGVKEDIKDKALERKIAAIHAKFSPLNV